jgi:hypothetical protein
MGYFLYTFSAPRCRTTKEVQDAGGTVVQNPNGTVSVYQPNGLPVALTKPCCERLDPSYTFDFDNQECRWSDTGSSGTTCPTDLAPFKIVLNPEGNDGVIFSDGFDANETCILDISFDYLFNFECDKVLSSLNSLQSAITDEEVKLLQDLEGKKEEIDALIKSQQTQLTQLITQLENTPYVIVCEDTNLDLGGGELGGDLPVDNDPIRSGDDNTSDNPLGTLPDPFNPTAPFSFPEFVTYTYCLTALGLQSWETILGTNTYNDWVNSEGSNTSLYGCNEVNQLVTLDGNTGNLLGLCSVDVNERQVLVKRITELQTLIKRNIRIYEDLCAQIEAINPNADCDTFLEILENLDVCMTLEIFDSVSNTHTTVYEEQLFNVGAGNLYQHLVNTSGQTGFFISALTQTQLANSGQDCKILGTQWVTDLIPQSGAQTPLELQALQALFKDSFESNWLNFETRIDDPNIINQLINKKIKISLKVKDCCVDFGILVDRIVMDKKCTSIDSTALQISKCPGFDLVRVCDNKKSWLTNEDPKHREFDLKHRDTQYDINNYKLALNSKEVDLDINPANAIEQDVFCYIQDNPCLLDCSTGGTTSITFDTDLDFVEILSAETVCCDASYTSACTLDSVWNIEAILGCETIYSNESFYTSTGITDTPTQAMYITELNNIATALGLGFTTGATSVTFSHTIDCDDINYLDKTLSVNLGLDITTTCLATKQFQDGENFQFQDGEDYDFN